MRIHRSTLLTPPPHPTRTQTLLIATKDNPYHFHFIYSLLESLAICLQNEVFVEFTMLLSYTFCILKAMFFY